MRRNLMSAATLGFLAIVFGPALATAQEPKAADQRPGSGLQEIRKIGSLLEADVLNTANEKVADVEDLILTPEGTILYAILGQGGLAGVGTKYYGVPWERFEVKHFGGKWAVNLAMSKEDLARAPALESDDYREMTNPDWVARDRAFFLPRDKTPEAGNSRVVSTMLRASKINDAKLRNAQNEDVGEVEDLLLDRNYRVAYAIIGRGGVLGIGESYVPVPWSKVRLSHDREAKVVKASIDATRQRLEQAPLIKDDYSTLLGPGFADQVDRYFGATRADTTKP